MNVCEPHIYMTTAQRKSKYLTSSICSIWTSKMKPYLSTSQWLSTFPGGKKKKPNNQEHFFNQDKISMTTSETLRPIAPDFHLWALTVSNRLQKLTETIQGAIQEQPTHTAGTKVSYFQSLNINRTVAAECSSLLLSSSILSHVTVSAYDK